MAPPHSPLAAALGLNRVADPAERLAGVLPQAAWRLDPSPRIRAGEVRIRVDRLNLDAASYRQLSEADDGDGDAIRDAVREIVESRGKMHNPVTGSGGMLTGVVDEVDADSPLGLKPGDRIATLVSLTLTPLKIYDGLAVAGTVSRSRSPATGTRSCSAVRSRPCCLTTCQCRCLWRSWTSAVRLLLRNGSLRGWAWTEGKIPGGSPTERRQESPLGPPPLTVMGQSWPSLAQPGKSGSLSAAAARSAGAGHVIGVVPTEAEASLLREVGSATPAPTTPATGPLVDEIVIADARQPVPLAEAVAGAGGPADVTVVCVDVAGCEGGAILSTAQGGTVIFFSMATSFSAAALGAEGVAADVTMLVGNGYTPGHADLALDLIRGNAAVRALFTRRLEEPTRAERESKPCQGN